MNDHHRKTDEIVIRTEQKLDDLCHNFNEWQIRHLEFHKDIERRICCIEDFVRRIESPFKLMFWTVGVTFGALFGAFGIKLFHWLETHLLR